MSTPADEPSRLRQLHALSGVFPLGVFLLEHLVLNAKALYGQASYERANGFVDRLPLFWLVQILFVSLPLAFHVVYGVRIWVDKKDTTPSPYTKSWSVLSRGAAKVALLFIAYHLWALWVPRWTQGVTSSGVHTLLTAHLSSATGGASGVAVPWAAVLYLIGIAATTVHFAAGTWGYLVRARRVTTPRGKRRAAFASGAIGTALFALASVTVISIASGSPLFPERLPMPPCPSP